MLAAALMGFAQFGPHGMGRGRRPLPPSDRLGRPGGPGARPGRNPIDRWNAMSPEERERELQKLPPERQQQIRERLERFNSLPPEQQERLRQRWAMFHRLPPDRQQKVRRDMRALYEMEPERRRAMVREFAELDHMSESDRESRFKSEEFRTRFTPEEQKILHDLADIPNEPPKEEHPATPPQE